MSEAMWEAAQALRVPARETKNAKGNFRGSAKGSNNGGGRNPVGRHLLTKGLLRCGTCGDSMSPITKPRASGDPCESYRCNGHNRDKESCSQLPVPREVIDTAIMNELDKRYLDLKATRDRLAARRAADAGLAAETETQAQADALRAAERLGRVRRAFQDGHLEPEDYAEQRACLVS